MSLSVVSFGGGVNSTALLVGLHERGERPDLILFSDTGGELDPTYHYVNRISEWCESVGFPSIVTVRYDSPHGTLEQECLNNKTLPSLAFGFKGCSVKWKRQPMDKYVKAWPPAVAAFGRGERITRLIGIDWGEQHRGKIPDDKWFVYRFPLVEWGWARPECIEAIRRETLPVPQKSACFFCPALKKHEVVRLADERPDLFERAVAIEQNAAPNLQSTRGLGRAWSWEKLVKGDRMALPLFPPDVVETACMCFDGDE